MASLQCIYWKRNLNCRCTAPGLANTSFCKTHTTAAAAAHSNLYQLIIDVLPQPTDAFNPYNITDLSRLEAIPTNLTAVFSHITTLEMLREWYGKYNCKINNKRKTKAQYVAILTELTHNIWKLVQRPKFVASLAHAQKTWRTRPLAGPPADKAVNDTDPFTFDKISELPPDNVFTYTDERGQIYAFSAQHLQYAIKALGPWNPYTRSKIAPRDLRRLNKIQVPLTETELVAAALDNPATTRDAYMNALYEFDRLGFYTNMDWFANLSSQQVVDVCYAFNDLNRHYTTALRINDLHQATINEEVIMFFAKEMRQLIIHGGDRKFALACNLLSALTTVSSQARREMPNWVYLGAV